jgi:RNA polymerase-binding transcription factor DksA
MLARFCCHCGKSISEERLRKGSRVFFCSDECRFADRNERKHSLAALRREKGQCVGCGRPLPSRKQLDPNTRVHAPI